MIRKKNEKCLAISSLKLAFYSHFSIALNLETPLSGLYLGLLCKIIISNATENNEYCLWVLLIQPSRISGSYTYYFTMYRKWLFYGTRCTRLSWLANYFCFRPILSALLQWSLVRIQLTMVFPMCSTLPYNIMFYPSCFLFCLLIMPIFLFSWLFGYSKQLVSP